MHSHEDYSAEIRVQTVGYEERREHDPPARIAEKIVLVEFQSKQHGKDSQRNQIYPDLENRESQPVHQLVQRKYHFCKDIDSSIDEHGKKIVEKLLDVEKNGFLSRRYL